MFNISLRASAGTCISSGPFNGVLIALLISGFVGMLQLIGGLRVRVGWLFVRRSFRFWSFSQLLKMIYPSLQLFVSCSRRVPIFVFYWLVFLLKFVGELFVDHLQFPKVFLSSYFFTLFAFGQIVSMTFLSVITVSRLFIFTGVFKLLCLRLCSPPELQLLLLLFSCCSVLLPFSSPHLFLQCV